MRIYILRHGETDWNTVRRLQGRTDIPLNDNGRSVARLCGRGMKEKGLQFDRVISSPLGRSLETARIILDELGQSGIPLTTDQRIIEISFGIYEGYSAIYHPDYPCPDPDWHYFMDDPSRYRAPEGAETFDMLLSRTGDFLGQLASEDSSPEENVLVSVHGCASRALLYHMTDGIDLAHFWQGSVPKNCAVSIAQSHGDGWKLLEKDILYYQ